MQKDLISVVIPVYGDKRLVRILYSRLIENLSKLDVDFEIIMVCDACPYGSADEIRELALEDNRVKFIDLQRNFGQHIAIKAGIDAANGDYTMVMDCDLQDNPQDIPRFYNKIKECNCDVIYGEREEREEKFIKKFYSKAANKLIQAMGDVPFFEGRNVSNFSIFNKKVLQELKNSKEPYFVFGTIIDWAGFTVEYINIRQEKREIGKSGYNFIKGLNHLKRIIINNSNRPLMFAGCCASIMFLLCILFAAKLFVDYFVFHYKILGYTSLMVAIFLIAGLLFTYLRILGVYIGQLFKISQHRSLYVVKRKMNL